MATGKSGARIDEILGALGKNPRKVHGDLVSRGLLC
jgi:hypothetical protein